MSQMIQVGRREGPTGTGGLTSIFRPITEIRRRLDWYDRTMEARSRSMGFRKASWDAEERVLQGASAHRRAIATFQGVRIPDPRSIKSKGEVDVVLLTDRGIVMIEVKHWKGDVSLDDDGDDIVQRVRRPKKPISRLRDKCEMLKRMAVSRYSESVGEVFPLVVLTHRACRPSEEVRRLHTVCQFHELESKIDSLLGGLDPADASHSKRMGEMIPSFGTWDSIEYGGGAKEIGDFEDKSLPLGWYRKPLASVEVKVRGGRLATLLRGPRLEVVRRGRDGEVTTSLQPKGAVVRLHQPWERKGRRAKEVPIEYISRAEFGYSEPVDWASMIETTHEGGRDTRPKEVSGDPLSRFKEGDVVVGTVVKHLRGDDGTIHGTLVSLVENQVIGKVSTRELGMMPEMYEHFYRIGNQVDVRILGIRGEKAISLRFEE